MGTKPMQRSPVLTKPKVGPMAEPDDEMTRDLFAVIEWGKVKNAVLMVGGTVNLPSESVQYDRPSDELDELDETPTDNEGGEKGAAEFREYLLLYNLQRRYEEARVLPDELAERLAKAKAAIDDRERTLANNILTRNIVQSEVALETAIQSATPRCQPLLRDLAQHYRSHFPEWCAS